MCQHEVREQFAGRRVTSGRLPYLYRDRNKWPLKAVEATRTVQKIHVLAFDAAERSPSCADRKSAPSHQHGIRAAVWARPPPHSPECGQVS
jgi:hypothetical protein